MNDIVKYSILVVCLVIVLVCAGIIFNSVTKKNKILKMKTDIKNVIEEICHKNSNSNYEIVENECYNYKISTEKNNYFIKIIDNRNNEEICINNSTKWQLRKGFNDQTLRFVPDVESFMRKDLEGYKIFVIYPNARSLLKYVNECEMIIVRSDTDVYGTNVVTFQELKENSSIIQ